MKKDIKKYKYLTAYLLLVSAALVLGFLVQGEAPIEAQSQKEESQLVSERTEASQEEETSEAESEEKKEETSSEDDKEDKKEEKFSQDYSQYQDVEDVIWAEVDYYGYPDEYLAFYYYDFQTGEGFSHQSTKPFHAASTNKVTTALLYANLIANGQLSWDSEIYYNPNWYEDGGGEITVSADKAAYSIEELVFQSLYYSDNTAWNHLVNNYYAVYGDFQSAIVSLAQVVDPAPELFELNYASAEMLSNVLDILVSDPFYEPIVETMLIAQEGMFLKQHVNEGMATKYGQYGNNFHDFGVKFDEDGEPLYSIVVMSENLYPIDDFLGDLNLHLWEYYQYTHE